MRAASAALLLVATAGCVRVPRGAGFDDVQRSLSTRTSARVSWNQARPRTRRWQSACVSCSPRS